MMSLPCPCHLLPLFCPSLLVHVGAGIMGGIERAVDETVLPIKKQLVAVRLLWSHCSNFLLNLTLLRRYCMHGHSLITAIVSKVSIQNNTHFLIESDLHKSQNCSRSRMSLMASELPQELVRLRSPYKPIRRLRMEYVLWIVSTISQHY
jgi:hypothetical protein